MKHLQNGAPYAEQMEDVLMEYEDDDEMVAEYDDDDDEAIVAEYDDDLDESYAEYDDDDDEAAEFEEDESITAEFDDDDDDEASSAEFIGPLNPFNIIGRGIKGIRRLVRGRRRRRSSRSLRPRILRHRVGRGRFRVNPRSRLMGNLRVGRRRVPFKLPSNVATKADVQKLALQVRKDVRLNGVAIKKNAAGIRAAIGLARKANRGVSEVDRRYKKAALEQAKVTNAINKRVAALKKSHDESQQRAQQQAMFSLFMQPDIEKIKLKKEGEDEYTEYEAKDADFETNLLPLLMGMGGMGSGSKGGMDPLMMFALMQAMD